MIAGIFHRGSGIGNQLHRYVMTRVLALDKGYEFGMVAPELFKGKRFMELDMGKKTEFEYQIKEPQGKVIPQIQVGIWGSPVIPWEEWDKQMYDPDINFVQDNTIIDGNFEDERYFEHRLPEIKEWLQTTLRLPTRDDRCIIGFRGGEYYAIPELGLPLEYFERGIEEMKKINPDMKFEVHTDDEELARKFFPHYLIVKAVSANWLAVREAKYAIIANSSFYVLPRLLKHHDNPESVTIAPRYWNRYNIQRWDYPQGYYKKFTYI